MMHDAIVDRPKDMLIGMHMCRGNFRSTWVAEGAYDPAADAIFNQTDVDIYFMEYDTERAGGLEPLRLLPKGKKRVLPGFITTKTPELEIIDDLKRQFEEASKYADIDQLGIAPQCGFASTEEGNSVTFDDQRRKLELVVRLRRGDLGRRHRLRSAGMRHFLSPGQGEGDHAKQAGEGAKARPARSPRPIGDDRRRRLNP